MDKISLLRARALVVAGWLAASLLPASGQSADPGPNPNPGDPIEPPASTITILHPRSGARILSPGPVIIEAVAIDPAGDIRHLDFFADGDFIGSSDYLMRIATIPGRPIPHRLEWVSIRPGAHRLEARGRDTLGRRVVSNPVEVIATPNDQVITPVVRIEATSAVTSEPIPTAFIRPGAFAIHRTGPRTSPLTVFLNYSGTADPTRDCERLPPSIVIPAGESTTTLTVLASADDLVEGTERLVAEIVESPAAGPLPSYDIHPVHHLAEIAIRDADTPVQGPATLVLDAPRAGTVFPVGMPIIIEATAIDPSGYIARIEFFSGERRIGVSELAFLVAPEPGTPIHHSLEWTDAPPGTHALVARAVDSAGERVESQPVRIHVRDHPTPRASIVIREPAHGSVFELGQDIRIHAVAVDEGGYISRVEFFDGERSIGVSEIVFVVPPEPGTPIEHHFEWSGADAGVHTLVARAEDSAGQPTESDPVVIVVGEVPLPVTLSVHATDPRASEPGDPATVDTGTFVVTRESGPTDIAVSVAYALEGTARNGADYTRLSGSVLLPAGESEARIVVVALADRLREGDESVVIRLLPIPCAAIFPTPPWCYRIEGSGEAEIIIEDSTPDDGNEPPRVAILDPPAGMVFETGIPISIKAEASDADGSIALLEILAGDSVLGRAEAPTLTITWTDAPVGLHSLRARATDDERAVTTSSRVVIYVRDAEERAFVRRQLPPAYLPGGALEVRLISDPPRHAGAWTVEDAPPAGWVVSDITDQGAWDAAAGKVKFGPFTDPGPRELGYRATPPADAAGVQSFSGTASLDGESYPVVGQDQIRPAGEFHPADASPQDHSIGADEVTAYAAAWKRGAPWGDDGQSIPVSYVTRAGFLWKSGEDYVFDAAAGAPPECWKPATSPPLGLAGGAALPDEVIPVERQGSVVWRPGVPGEIHLMVTPPPGTKATAVEEKVPQGWSVMRISDGGEFDGATGCVRWGLFLGDTSRRLTYVAVPPPGAAGTGVFVGSASFDGSTVAINGVRHAGASDETTALRIVESKREIGGRLRLRISAPTDQVFAVEASSDLRNWDEVEAHVFTGDDLEVNDPASAHGATQRYYRLRPVGR